MVNINQMPTTIKLLIIELMIVHMKNLPGELRIVDAMMESLEEYKKTNGDSMPQDVGAALERLKIMRDEYRKAVDEVLELAEHYELINRAELDSAAKAYKLLT